MFKNHIDAFFYTLKYSLFLGAFEIHRIMTLQKCIWKLFLRLITWGVTIPKTHEMRHETDFMGTRRK